MEINKLNSLIELYFKKCNEIDRKKTFLSWLKPGKQSYNWGDVREKIFKLSFKIKSLISEGERCLILSENRPNWLISDIAVMNAGGISLIFGIQTRLAAFFSVPNLTWSNFFSLG